MINCPEDGCPLVGVSPTPKFCTLCGASAASKTIPDRNTCKGCGYDFGDTIPNFCGECGARAAAPPPTPGPPAVPRHFLPEDATPTSQAFNDRPKPYGSVGQLLAEHEARRAQQGLPGGRKGRGLTAEEAARLERNVRTPADRGYSGPGVDSEFMDVTGLQIPDKDLAHRSGLPEESGRTATWNEEGTHKPGGLSPKGSQVEPGYHEGVRVLPYSFRTKAHSDRQLVGGGKRDLTPQEEAEAEEFFRQHPDDESVIDQLLRPKK